MHDSRRGHERLPGPIPYDWDIGTLGAVASRITDGTHQTVTVSADGRGAVPFLYVSCVRNGRIHWSEAAAIDEHTYATISRGREPRAGMILYTAVGSYGHAAVVEANTAFSFQRHIACLYLLSQRTDPRFVSAWLNSRWGRRIADVAAIGNAQKTITLGAVARLPLPIPPLPEQRAIAAVLDTIDDAIRKTEQIIAKLQQVKQGLLHDLLTRGIDGNDELRDPERHPEQFQESPLGRIPKAWSVEAARDVCSAVIDCKNRTPPACAEGHPVIRTSNVRDGEFVTDGLVYTDPISYGIWTQRGRPQSGDVLITREAPVGEACLVPSWLPPACLGQRMMMYQSNPSQMSGNFMLAALLSRPIQKNLRDLAGGSTVGHVRVDDIRNLLLPVPPLDEQHRIAGIWDAYQHRLAAEVTTVEKLAALKSGLAEDLLTGRVRTTSLSEVTP